MTDLIPSELRNLKNWGVWKYEEVRGRNTKVPYQIDGVTRASSTNPATWGTYDEAMQIATYVDGLAFFFSDGYFGIDLDHVEDDIDKFIDGEEEGIVYEFINQINSYAEISPSGEGVHIICKGKLPQGNRRKGNVEMYDRARFFTVTGNALVDKDDEVFEIKESTDTVIPLFEKYIGYKSTSDNNTSQKIVEVPEQVIVEFFQKNQDDKFLNLFNGKWRELYPSQSEADMAFCNMLAYRTKGDVSLMNAVFRMSKLYREKWEREDYSSKTLNSAIQGYLENKQSDYSINIVKQKKFSYDDTGNAERFADTFKGDVYYCSDLKQWTYYDPAKNKWCRDDFIVVKRMFDKVIENMKYEKCSDPEALQKHIKSSRSSVKKKNALTEAQHLIPVKSSMFDTHCDLFNLKNGFIDLKTNTFYEPDHNKLFMQVAGVDFNPNSKCDRWLKFLNEIFLGDQELIDYIQKVLGYSLSGNIIEQLMLVFFGDGQNGKSIFTEVLRELLGDYSANMDIKSLMVRGSNATSSDIARLKGKRFVSTSENNEGSRLDEGLVKQLTGGDVITARHLYQSEIEFTPQCTICMTTNHKPIIRGTDDGIWRRIVLIPFKYKVPKNKIDKHLKSKLLNELPGILNWLLEGSKKYNLEGLTLPDACKRETEEYKLEMDPIARFINERCLIENPNSKIKASDLYLNYCSWAESNNEYVMTNTKFGRKITKEFNKIKKEDGFYYTGICIKTA